MALALKGRLLARLRRAVEEASEVLNDVGLDQLREDQLEPRSGLFDELRDENSESWSGREPLDETSAPAAPAGDDELSDQFAELYPIASPMSSPMPWSSVVARTFNREAEREAREEAAEGLSGTSGARLEAFMAAVASAFDAVEGELDARVGQAPAPDGIEVDAAAHRETSTHANEQGSTSTTEHNFGRVVEAEQVGEDAALA